LGLLLALVACTPALNWRDARAASGALIALFPCRPDEQTRTVELAGQRLQMSLQSCEAQGALFALTSVELPEAAPAGPVLAALSEGVASKLRVLQRSADPLNGAGGGAGSSGWARWTLTGMATDGHQRVIELAQFSHGRWAFQASVVAGEPVSPEARQPFFDGFRWAP